MDIQCFAEACTMAVPKVLCHIGGTSYMLCHIGGTCCGMGSAANVLISVYKSTEIVFFGKLTF